VVGSAAPSPGLVEGAPADLVVFDRGARWTVEHGTMLSRGWGNPLLGRSLPGTVLLTVASGRLAWEGAEPA
jgi:dihydroorotase